MNAFSGKESAHDAFGADPKSLPSQQDDGTLAFLASTELLNSLQESEIRDIQSRMEPCALEDGQVLIREGDDGNDLFIIVSGRLRVSAPALLGTESSLAELQAGDTVGEMAFLTGDPRTATVYSEGPAQLLRLRRDRFVDFARLHPAAAHRMTEPMIRRLRKAHLAFALRLSNAFASFEENVLRDLESELETVTISGGEVLFRQGESGDSLYFVMGGRLRVLVEKPDGSAVPVAELGAGETVGEMAVVTGEARTATVCALRDSLLARLPREGYDRMLLKHPKIISQTITSRIVARLRQSNSGTPIRVPATSSFAVIPAGDEVPLHDFCESLARSLARFGRTLHVTSGSLDGHLGKQNISHTPPEDLDNLRIVQWLGRAELDHQYLVYEADARFSNWNRRCLRQADQVLIVGASGADPRPGLVEKQVMSHEFSGPGVSLVLLHRRDGMPSATIKWLEARKVDRHYHVRLGSDPDVDRLARFLTGRALGLALGGGFARGLAHVGVFRALDDLGIPVDAVGGSSMGAVIGAQWAQAWDYERMIRETSSECVGALNDLTFPFIAFHGGGKFSGAIRKFTGDTQIEDLRLPFFCVSANLNRAEMKVHTQGSLMKAVLASTRAPGIFPPIVYDGELHVDGGVLNNVPVDLVKRFCRGGTVFGVDVSPPHELNPIQDYGIEMSGWEAFRRRFGRFGRAKTYVPSILLIMMRTIEFGGVSYKKLIADSSDLYLQPPLLQFKRTDFSLAPQIVDVSYRYARERIEAWLSRGAAPVCVRA